MDDTESLKTRLARRLLRWGMLLFLLALLTGLTLPAMANSRMGLASHLEGVMNGMLLVLLGLVWPKLRLEAKPLLAGYWLVLYGAYANWATTLVAGFLGAGEKMMPLASAGHRGSALQETLIAVSLVALCIAMLAAVVIVLLGLRGDTEAEG